jgi:hypothetical protein
MVTLMRLRRPEAGVCLVRVEVQGDHLLITVTTNTSISRSLYPAPDAPKRFVDPDRALEEVARFLDAFSSSIGT